MAVFGGLVSVLSYKAALQAVPEMDYWPTYVKVRSPQVAADLDQAYNRVRLAGATCVNLVLIGAAGLALAIHKVGLSWQLLVLSTTIGVALVVLFFMTFRAGLSQFRRNLRIAVIVLASNEKHEPTPKVTPVPED